jgi:hypothetical protein
MVHDSR